MRRLTTVLVMVVLFASACGSDESTESVESAQEAEATTEVVATATAEPAEPTAAPTAAPTKAAEPTPAIKQNDPPTGDANSDWCKAARAVELEFDKLDGAIMTDPKALEEAYTGALDAIKQARKTSPPQLEDAVDQTIDGFELLTDAFKEAKWSFLDLDLSVMADIDTEMTAATDVIDEYNFTVCGMDNGFDPDADPALSDSDSSAIPQGTVRENAIAEMVNSGFTQAEAACFLDKVDFAALAEAVDPSEIIAVFTDCGISLDRLGQLGG